MGGATRHVCQHLERPVARRRNQKVARLPRRNRDGKDDPPEAATRQDGEAARGHRARRRRPLNQSLTVVLPIHNVEATLRQNVDHVLEVASGLTPGFELLIVDDGSTDDSFDIAREIASEYPQVQVMRQSHRRGLGATLKNVRRRVKSDIIMVHDGVSSTNAEQLRALWDRRIDSGQPSDVSTSDLLRPAQNQAAMAAAHQRLMSFQLLSPDAEGNAEPDAATPIPSPKMLTPSPETINSKDVGGIPTLPRPNFMGAMSDFALGE